MKRATVSMVFLAVIASCSPNVASAQQECKLIPDSLKRLACYDSSAAPSETAKPKGTAVENWLVSEKTNPLTDAREATAILESESKGRLGRSPALVVRCSNGEVNAYINWANYLSDNAVVTYRFDKNPPAG